ncbi:unnamed protein product [Pieris brassicae]|uniref:Peptidase S1 domain-containing protein n=1 Tax=Pieris brassicae TaxID=7116 RepID=A0A9P0TA18_PIEBR|nr:unnamed protein product [Pieris brassicae]
MGKNILMDFLICVLLLFNILQICASQLDKKSADYNEPLEDSAMNGLDIVDQDMGTSNNVSMCVRRQNTLMHEIQTASPKQFPFVVALMSQRNEYVCAGSIVANGIILTSGHCTQLASYALVNTTSDKKDEATIQLHVIKTENFPTYTGPDAAKNVGVLFTEKHNNTIASKIRLSNVTDGKNLNEMEAIGFGLNTEVGQPKTLQVIGVEQRSITGDVIQGFVDCIETKVPTCFKDLGGPVIFDSELIGVVTKGQNECTKEMTTSYAINKHVVDVLPIYTFKAWLDDQILKNQEQVKEPLEIYPSKPIFREAVHVMTSSGNGFKISLSLFIFQILYKILLIY